MRKTGKVAVFVLVLLTLGVASAVARDGGLRVGLEVGDPPAVIIIRPAPLDFKIGYNFDRSNPYLFLSGDYRLISGYQLVEFLHFFLGVGLYTQIYFNNPGSTDFGARIPFGLQVFLFNSVLELFVEVAPTVGFLPAIRPFPHWQGWVGFTLRI